MEKPISMKFALLFLVGFLISLAARASSCQIPSALSYDITPSVTFTDNQGVQVSDTALVPILSAEPRLMKAYLDLRSAVAAHVVQTGFGVIVQMFDGSGRMVGALHHHFAKPSAFLLSLDNDIIPVHYYLYGSMITGMTVHFTHSDLNIDVNFVFVAREVQQKQEHVAEDQHHSGPHSQN